MFVLESAVYRASDHWGPLVARGQPVMVDALGRVIGSQLEAALAGFDRREIGANMVVTTMLDMPFTVGWLTWSELRQACARHTDTVPQSLVSSFECSSWGYVLRYAHSLVRAGRPLPPLMAITVIDINIFNLSYWHANPNWGESGFGVATVVVRLDPSGRVDCNVAKAANGFGEFCIDLRNRMQADPTVIVTPPFFPPHISALYDRLLPQDRLLPNRVDTWGHSFGADPWIALIEQRQLPHARANRYLATSVSLNGYWCCAELQLGEGSNFVLQERLRCPDLETCP
jgi:hypothetical protein